MPRISAYSFAAILLLALAASPAYPDIYKYVDNQGTVHFSNIPEQREAERIIREDVRPVKESGPTLYPADGPKDYVYKKEGAPLPEAVPYADIINKACDAYGVEPSLVRAIIKTESNFNPRAVSSKGARGLMQLMPATARELDVTDSFDPSQNIYGGVRYFRELLDNFSGDVELALAAYNCGQGRVIRNGHAVPDIKETKDYVKKVQRLSDNPFTGRTFSRPLYRVELKDGSVLFTDNPVGETASIVE